MRKIYFLSDIFIILFVLFAESFLCVFKYVSIYTGDKHNCVIKGNIIKSSSLRRVKQEENVARFRCLLFRYTGSYSQFISGCMDGSFRLLRLFHSLTQPPRVFFPVLRRTSLAFLWFISIHRRGRKSMELVTNLLHRGKAGD